jgi:uncharacterized membrane protein YfcA
MPGLFPDLLAFVLSALVVAGAQLIYATVGFGAGMFSIALLALVLPDLSGTVAALWLLTFVTEVGVLAVAWREARLWLLIELLPTTIVGLWIGTAVLTAGDVGGLKRLLGAVVLVAGTWFLHEQRVGGARRDANSGQRRAGGWWAIPAGLASGTLAGLFGTGGPPVIVFLRAYRLEKGGFRATILWFFLMMSLIRGAAYWRAGLLDGGALLAAAWLLPASLAGMGAGLLVHRRLSERGFGFAVASVLMVLGGVLLATGGR